MNTFTCGKDNEFWGARVRILSIECMTNLNSVLKKQKHHVADKDLYSQSYGFSSSHVQM